VGNVFVVNGLDLARRGGRLSSDVNDAAGVPVLALVDGVMDQLGSVADIDGAVTVMSEYVRVHAAGRQVRVGVGDARAEEAAVALVTTLRRQPEVVEVVRYEVGPSVVVHTGLGTVGACFFTAP
jgi:fatty acid-binding protein DegV